MLAGKLFIQGFQQEVCVQENNLIWESFDAKSRLWLLWPPNLDLPGLRSTAIPRRWSFSKSPGALISSVQLRQYWISRLEEYLPSNISSTVVKVCVVRLSCCEKSGSIARLQLIIFRPFYRQPFFRAMKTVQYYLRTTQKRA